MKTSEIIGFGKVTFRTGWTPKMWKRGSDTGRVTFASTTAKTRSRAHAPNSFTCVFRRVFIADYTESGKSSSRMLRFLLIIQPQ